MKRIPARAVRTVRELLSPRITEMPTDMDYCESDCRRLDCFAEDWANCRIREDAVQRRQALESAAKVTSDASKACGTSATAGTPRAG